MVVEAGVAAGYVIAWAMRKARRVGGRLDAEADEVIDASLDRLHDVVEAKLGNHPVLHELAEEAAEAASGEGQVTKLTRQQIELAITAAARKDEMFGAALMELIARLRDAERNAEQKNAGVRLVAFTGDANTEATGGGIAFGQVAGDIYVGREPANPPRPGRSSH